MNAIIMRRLLGLMLLFGLSVQPLLADRIWIGNPHRQGCKGIGFGCRLDGPVRCPREFDADFLSVTDDQIILGFHDLPTGLRSEQTFGTAEFFLPDPQRFGYKSIKVLPGEYPFDWNTEQVSFKVVGQRDPSVLFSDLSVQSKADGDKYVKSGGWQVSGSASSVGVSTIAASQFTPANSGTAYRLDLAIGLVSGENAFTVSIYADDAGQPGALLWSQAGITTNQNYPGCCGLVTVVVGGAVTLNSGTDYWIAIGPTNSGSTTLGMWNQNSFGRKGTQVYSNDGGNTWNGNGQQVIGAFDILAQ